MTILSIIIVAYKAKTELAKCLASISEKKEWEVIAEKLGNMPTTDKSARDYARLMLAGAMDIVPDKLGRIVLPQYLRDFASLKKNIITAGLYNRIEIWNEEAWKKYEKDIEKNSSDIADKLSEFGV